MLAQQLSPLTQSYLLNPVTLLSRPSSQGTATAAHTWAAASTQQPAAAGARWGFEGFRFKGWRGSMSTSSPSKKHGSLTEAMSMRFSTWEHERPKLSFQPECMVQWWDSSHVIPRPWTPYANTKRIVLEKGNLSPKPVTYGCWFGGP